MKKIIILISMALMLLTSGMSTLYAKNAKQLVVGVAPGPYADLFKYAIAPSLEKEGYKISFYEFSDYVQPNLALANKAIDVNVFQHSVYLKKFSDDKGLKLSPIINVPTAGAGIYSRKIKSLDELKSGDKVTFANDPTNLARALRLLQKHGILKLNPNLDPATVSEKDIVENPKNLIFTPIEAAQTPRSLDSVAISVINGNYAIAAGISISSALIKEELTEELKNVIAVRTEDLHKQFVKDIQDAVRSAYFHQVVEDPKYGFENFQKPDWYVKKWPNK
ncbi:MAG TPA: metal ABC transporter substrate-binding protein [Firmicutes bacterium]|nr:metal ABC transporter substrate-binding protein [Bacillota bacterium]